MEDARLRDEEATMVDTREDEQSLTSEDDNVAEASNSRADDMDVSIAVAAAADAEEAEGAPTPMFERPKSHIRYVKVKVSHYAQVPQFHERELTVSPVIGLHPQLTKHVKYTFVQQKRYRLFKLVNGAQEEIWDMEDWERQVSDGMRLYLEEVDSPPQRVKEGAGNGDGDDSTDAKPIPLSRPKDVGSSLAVDSELEAAIAQSRTDFDRNATMESDLEVKLLTQRGLKLKRMRDDGNCLFLSLSDQLHGHDGEHTFIRQAIVEHMAAYPQVYMPFMTDDFDVYLSEMSLQRTYGTHLELQAFSRLFHRPVEVFSDTNPDGDPTIVGDFTGVEPVRVSFHRGNHYNSVVPVSDASEAPVTQAFPCQAFAPVSSVSQASPYQAFPPVSSVPCIYCDRMCDDDEAMQLHALTECSSNPDRM